MSVVGIDFGTINCLVAAAQKGGVDVLTNEVSSRMTPCMVAFEEKGRAIGEPAMTGYARNIKNTITNVKRLLGRKWGEPEVMEEIKNSPYKVVELPDKEIGVEVFYGGEMKTMSVTAITAMVLNKLKQIAEANMQRTCRDVVISVPGYWTCHQRRAMLDAAQIAGLNTLRLLNDHTACALQYGIYKKDLSDTDPRRVMFIDMGYAATSVSIVEFLKGKLKVVSTAHDRNLGGRDFDKILVDHFAGEFLQKYKIDVKSNARAHIRLQLACEKLKKVLSGNPEAPINVESIMNDIDVRGMMKREEYFEMCKPLLQRLATPVNQALANAGLTAEALSSVELSGGGTRLLAVQNTLSEILHREMSKTLNFEECVVRGCALQCAILSPVFKVREYSITDITSYPIKVSWSNEENMTDADESAEVITKNNSFPVTKTISFSRREGFTLTATYSDPSLLPPQTPVLIGTYQVTEIPPTKEEKPRIQVKVRLDGNELFFVESVQLVETVEEAEATPETPATPASPSTPNQTPTPEAASSPSESPKTEGEAKAEEKKENGEPKKKRKVRRVDIPVNQRLFGALSTKQVQELTEEEQRMAAADRLAIETAEKKNAVESYVYEMRSKLNGNLSQFAPNEEKEKLIKLLDATETWLYEEGEDQTKSVYVKKLEEMQKLGNPIVQRQYEFEHRYEVLNALRSVIEQFKLAATTDDPKYDHIPKEEKDKVVAECESVEKYVNSQMTKQDQLPKSVNPVVTCSELEAKGKELEKFCTAILNKPKPKPKEEKKEEKKPSEEKKPEGAAPQTDTPMDDANPSNNPDNKMDLD